MHFVSFFFFLIKSFISVVLCLSSITLLAYYISFGKVLQK